MSHKNCGCNHKLEYCSRCDVVYCSKCSKEWGNNNGWTYYQTPYTFTKTHHCSN